jgi:hypothetical protein
MIFPGRESISMENSIRTRLSDDELALLHYRLGELEKRPGWRRRCFFARLMLASGMKLREALPARFQDVLLDYGPP